MSDFNETTADDLKAIRGDKLLNQDDIAAILGITQTAVSKIEGGTRALSDSEKKLLDWYFFGTVPERIHASAIDLKRMLEFDEAEWLIIGHISRRRGLTEAEWIASRIRDYLAILDESQLSALPTPIQAAAEKQA
jgi:transcriptional regulator with XRE-family HTH domain